VDGLYFLMFRKFGRQAVVTKSGTRIFPSFPPLSRERRHQGFKVSKGSGGPPPGFKIVKGKLVAKACAECQKRKKGCLHEEQKLRQYRKQQGHLGRS
jgi:hypothetical protein